MSTTKEIIARIESNNSYTAKNPTSTAYGKYQFLRGTNSYYAKKMGVSSSYLRTPEGQELAMDVMLRDNASVLRKHGLPVNTTNLYVLHQQGAGGGIDILKGDPSPKTLSLMKSNLPKSLQKGDIYSNFMKFYTSKTTGQQSVILPTEEPKVIQEDSMATSNIVAGVQGINSIASAFMAYEAGQMKKLAYEHEAAMEEINAKQVGIEAQFTMADKYDELTDTLAMQNVMAAATGRVAGSVDVLAQSSEAELKKEERKIRLTGKARSTAIMMGSASKRAAGKAAATTGLITGLGELVKGGTQVAKYIS